MDFLKNFFKKNWKDFFLSKFKYCAWRKREILKISLLIFALWLVAFLVEFFGFGKSFNQYRFLLILAVEALTAVFFLIRKKIGERPELGFLAVVLICGSLLSFSEPKAYVNWDEQIHYKNAEKISLAIMGGFSRPNTVKSSYSLQEQKKINEKVDSQYKKAQVKSRNFFEVFSYSKIAYLPSAIALIIGGILHLPYHLIFIFGRWINVLVYAVVIYFALRKLKTGKMIMSVIALFPTAIFLAANYNYDSWLTAFTMLGLAYLFTQLQEPTKKLTRRSGFIMVGAFVLGLSPKAIYFPLMMLLYLVGREKFSSLKKYRVYLAVTTLAILFVAGSFCLPFLAGGMDHSDNRGGNGVNSAQQVQFILSNPLGYLKILGDFTLNYINPLNAGGFVSFFAYLGMTKGFWILLCLLGIVTFTDRNEYAKKTSGWRMKLLMIVIYLINVALVSSALYVAFTPVGSFSINGVQPRYLIPLVFPLLFVLGGSRFKNPLNKNIYNLFIFSLVSVILLFGIWDLIIKFYN